MRTFSAALSELPARIQRAEVLRRSSRRLPMPVRQAARWAFSRFKWLLRRLGLVSSDDFPGVIRPWPLTVWIDPDSAGDLWTEAVHIAEAAEAPIIVTRSAPPIRVHPDAIVIDPGSQRAAVPDRLVPYGYDVARRHGLLAFGTDPRRSTGSRWEGQRVKFTAIPSAADARHRPDDLRRRLQRSIALIDPIGTYGSDSERARVLSWSAAAGLPVVVEDPESLQPWLPAAVLDTMCGISHSDLDDRTRRDAIAFRQWSAVLDHLGRWSVWSEVLDQHGIGAGALHAPEVTVVVTTRRPELVPWWSVQIAAQVYPRWHVIAVLHGPGFGPRHESVLRDHLGGSVEVVHVDASVSFGAALDAGSQRCDTGLVVKWDDDDLYSTTHLADLVRTYRYSGATLVGKASDFVYLAGRDVTIRRHQAAHEVFSPTMAGGTLCLAREDLVAVGGWPGLDRGVDAGLIAAIRDAGGTTYRSVGFGYLMVRRAQGRGHTWAVGDEHFLSAATEVWQGLAVDRALIDQDGSIVDQVRANPHGERPSGGLT